jgi:hypothetical protein
VLVTANVVPSSLILFTLMMEATHSSETSVLTRATRRHIQKDGVHQNRGLIVSGRSLPPFPSLGNFLSACGPHPHSVDMEGSLLGLIAVRR